MVIKKIELFSYIRGKSILSPEEMEGYEVRVFPVPKSFFQMLKEISVEKSICYALFLENRIVHACYLYKNVFINFLFGYRSYAVIGGCFTLNAYRGKGLYPNMLRKIANEISNNIVIYVATSNFSSIRGIEKAGFVRHKKLILFKCLGIPFYKKTVLIK